MKASLLLDALDLPECARVVKRVPKTMLHEHGAPTAADKRQINEGIEQLVWVAALKPTTIGVAEYRAELEQIGLSLIGQTAELAPSDKKLYALRDVTATVENLIFGWLKML